MEIVTATTFGYARRAEWARDHHARLTRESEAALLQAHAISILLAPPTNPPAGQLNLGLVTIQLGLSLAPMSEIGS